MKIEATSYDGQMLFDTDNPQRCENCDGKDTLIAGLEAQLASERLHLARVMKIDKKAEHDLEQLQERVRKSAARRREVKRLLSQVGFYKTMFYLQKRVIELQEEELKKTQVPADRRPWWKFW